MRRRSARPTRPRRSNESPHRDRHVNARAAADGRRVSRDGSGKVAAALNVLDGADHAARFLTGAARKGLRDDFTLRFATINGLPGVILDAPEDPCRQRRCRRYSAARCGQSRQVMAVSGGRAARIVLYEPRWMVIIYIKRGIAPHHALQLVRFGIVCRANRATQVYNWPHGG
jgi:hypothetical protein